MSFKRSIQTRPLPRWLVLAGSVVITLHLLAVLTLAVGAPNGPWPSPFGSSMAEGPPFATQINGLVYPVYFEPLRMTHNYHFLSNRVLLSEVRFEANLKDAQGKVTKTVKFPDEGANFWARHRQQWLAQSLGDDQPVQPPRTEIIPAPGQKMQMVKIWDSAPGENVLRLREVPEHLVPRDRPVVRPTDWSLLLARSYARHLAREHGAASVELIRRSREPIAPVVLLLPQLPPNTFEEMVANFGETRLEK